MLRPAPHLSGGFHSHSTESRNEYHDWHAPPSCAICVRAQAERAAGCCKGQGFGGELRDQPAGAGAESVTHGDIAVAMLGTQEHEAADVDGGDEQLGYGDTQTLSAGLD